MSLTEQAGGSSITPAARCVTRAQRFGRTAGEVPHGEPPCGDAATPARSVSSHSDETRFALEGARDDWCGSRRAEIETLPPATKEPALLRSGSGGWVVCLAGG